MGLLELARRRNSERCFDSRPIEQEKMNGRRPTLGTTGASPLKASLPNCEQAMKWTWKAFVRSIAIQPVHVSESALSLSYAIKSFHDRRTDFVMDAAHHPLRTACLHILLFPCHSIIRPCALITCKARYEEYLQFLSFTLKYSHVILVTH